MIPANHHTDILPEFTLNNKAIEPHLCNELMGHFPPGCVLLAFPLLLSVLHSLLIDRNLEGCPSRLESYPFFPCGMENRFPQP